MSHYIATKLHKAQELVPDDEFFAQCATLPHYVIDRSLREILSRGDVQASIAAMIEADIAHLPFERMLIEMETGQRGSHSFVILEEWQDRFRGQMGTLHPHGAAESSPNKFILTLEAKGSGIMVTTPFGAEGEHESWLRITGLALTVALLMLNIQGVEKEKIVSRALNKARKASGKPSISDHTVVRIGHVYTREGKRVKYGSTGRVMPVHMRAGHTRRQHFGEGNQEVKIIYVPPVLVNFRPGKQAKPVRKIIAA